MDKMEFAKDSDEEERDVEILAFMLCTMFDQNDCNWILEEGNESNKHD